MRAELTLLRLQKPPVVKYKATPKSAVLQEQVPHCAIDDTCAWRLTHVQLRKMDEQYKTEMTLLDDIQVACLRGVHNRRDAAAGVSPRPGQALNGLCVWSAKAFQPGDIMS